MMRSIQKKIVIRTALIGAALFLISSLIPASAWCQRPIVNVNPFLRKIPTAAPVFITIPTEHRALAEKSADIVTESLEFTGYFMMINRSRHPALSAVNPGALEPAVNYQQWRTAAGAELLITGGIRVTDKMIEMEMRLFDVVKGQLLIGKRYRGWQNDLRRMIQRFCSEVILHLTGNEGVFNSRIAFISNGSGHKEIYVCDFNGKNTTRLTSYNSITLSPAWSWDGQWMAYTSYAKGRPDLYIRHVREKRGTVVSRKGINTTPDWMPGQLKLAATMSFSGDQEIYLLSGKGAVEKRLTQKWGIDTSPSWSPDGRRLAFVSSRSGKPQIYVMDAAAGRAERLTFEGNYNTQPDWSPKGDKIAYSSIKGNEINIFTIGATGGSPMQLTRGVRKNESPAWSPDGSLIVFSSTREGRARLYVMTAFGTDQRRLLSMPGEQTAPAWSPNIISK